MRPRCLWLAALRATVRSLRQLVMLVAVGSLCTASAGCGYFPKQKEATEPPPSKDTFERKRICMEVGERVDQKERKGDTYGAIILEPTYSYNDSLKTCLYAGGLMNVKENYNSYWVRDCLTNQVLVECTMIKREVVTGLPLGEFNRMKAYLMTEREK